MKTKKNILKIFMSVLLTQAHTAAFAQSAGKGLESRPSSPAPAAPSINQGAQQTSGQNKGAQVTQYLMGGLMFTQSAQKYMEYSASGGKNIGALMQAILYAGLGMMSMTQGNEHGSAAGSADATAFQTDAFGGYNAGTGILDPYGNANGLDADMRNKLNTDKNFRALPGNIAALQKAGFLDPKKGTIKTPDGKTFKASDFASAGAMAAAGLPSGAIAGATDMYGQALKKSEAKAEKLKIGAMTDANGFAEGGGGGAGAGGAAGEEGLDGSAAVAGAAGLGGLNGKNGRDPTALAGMQKQYNGEPIGVAGDDIFKMMNRRYKVKETQESFFTDAELAFRN